MDYSLVVLRKLLHWQSFMLSAHQEDGLDFRAMQAGAAVICLKIVWQHNCVRLLTLLQEAEINLPSELLVDFPVFSGLFRLLS